MLGLARRVMAMFTARRDEAALDDELRSLLDLHTDAHQRRGLSPTDARAAARREIGSLASIRERVGDQRRPPFVDTLVQDVRLATRSLQREWRTSSVIVVTLALGIGANTALFSVIDAVLFEPLPYPDPDRLVWISEGEFPTVSGPDVEAWKAGARSIESLTAITSADATLSGENAQRVRALAVNDTLGRTFGIAPVRGRDFTHDDFLAAPRGAIEMAQPG